MRWRPPRCNGSSARSGGSGVFRIVLGHLEADKEPSADADFRFCPELASELLHNPGDDSEAQAQSTWLRRGRVGLLKSHKHRFELVCRNAGTRIADNDLNIDDLRIRPGRRSVFAR